MSAQAAIPETIAQPLIDVSRTNRPVRFVINLDNRMLDRRMFIAGLGTAAAAVGTNAAAYDESNGVRAMLRRRIDAEKRSVGMAVSVVTPFRQRIITSGRERLEEGRRVSKDTVFEIASITKIFTALLLAEMALRGEVGLDDPVIRHLPGDFRVPERGGRQITLTDLATHTAGLPASPPFPGGAQPWPFNAAYIAAFASFSLGEFKAWLADFHLQSRPGETWAYGNTDYALLSMALAHRGGRPYQGLLRDRVLDPLGLGDTNFLPTPREASHLAEGHDQSLTPLPPMDAGIFAGAAGLRSTPSDMGRFATAILPGSGAPIAPAAALMLTIRRPARPINGIQTLGWEIRDAPGGAFVSKDGVSWGQAASMVFDPGRRLAIIAFSNTTPDLQFATFSGGGVGASDIARHLLRPQIPLGGQGGTHY